MPSVRSLAVILVVALTACLAHGADFFVSPDGKPDNQGTLESPWDIQSALGKPGKVTPGSTVHLLPGVYKNPDRTWASKNWSINIKGTEEAPIHIRPYAGGTPVGQRPRVTIDSGVTVTGHASHLWIWDLEITITETAAWDRKVTEKGSHPKDPGIELPKGGLNISSGKNNKYINLVIHDNATGGVSFWRTATNNEMHGCLIYNNGWIAPDRYHGPGLYTQNDTGVKLITDNILFGNYSTAIQAYGSKKAFVNGYHFIGNVVFGPVREGRRNRFLVGSGQPSHGIVVKENYLYETPMQIGYTAPHNEDAIVQDNIVVRGTLGVSKFKQADVKDNLVIRKAGDPRPDEPARVILRPNKYDPDRANLIIYNWKKDPAVAADLSSFLKPGQAYRIVHATDFYGKPALEGTYDGQPVNLTIPVNADSGQGEFGVFILFRVNPAG